MQDYYTGIQLASTTKGVMNGLSNNEPTIFNIFKQTNILVTMVFSTWLKPLGILKNNCNY
ncbi:BAD_collapsed_G0018060.mRNA.1.CDS.1 [Saccharomyces cerevisiae]|nr:BAD_collapsed_G0018060.mRNA.1.CDS.1 [Saccharomyces cerevisiae]